MPFLPTIFDGEHTTHKNGDDCGMVQMALLYQHYPVIYRVSTIAGAGSLPAIHRTLAPLDIGAKMSQVAISFTSFGSRRISLAFSLDPEQA